MPMTRVSRYGRKPPSGGVRRRSHFPGQDETNDPPLIVSLTSYPDWLTVHSTTSKSPA
jgi:hypothetical protein